MQPRILVVGSAILDHVAYAPRFAKPGESLTASNFAIFPGGKGANQAVAATKLGAQVEFCGCVGDDDCGAALIRSLSENGVGVDSIQIAEGHSSGAAVIVVDANAQNQIIVYPGANMLLGSEAAGKLIGSGSFSTLLVQLEVPIDTISHSLILARASGMRTILNPAPAREVPEQIWQSVSLVTPNETEAEFFTGVYPTTERECEAVSRWFLDRGVTEVVLTLGARGCFVRAVTGTTLVAARPVEAIDATAAGDAFCGAISVFLSSGLGLVEAAKRANVVAAISTTRRGAQASLPSHTEFLEAWSR